MNRWWFSISFITTGLVMKTFLAGFKNVNFDSNITAFLVSMAISVPFTLIAYWVYKKRMDYIGLTVDRTEKIVFLLLPVFWFLWIAIYIYGVYQGKPIFRKQTTYIVKVEKNPMKISTIFNNIVFSLYGLVWVVILLFPPQYYANEFYRHYKPKFVFILYSNQLDYYLASFELIIWSVIGITLYFLLFRLQKLAQTRT